MDPQRGTLDQERWLGLWSRLGPRGSGASSFARLVTAYGEPGRTYHNAEHIRDCLAEFDRARDLTLHPDEVEAAIWFHDAVYLPGAADNEARSAELARTTLLDGAVLGPRADRIATLVLATTHHTIPHAPDEQLIGDVDLSILGREPAVFDEFERRIRREYATVSESTYGRERSAVFSGFLRRRFIYQTELFRQRYELSARANLQRLVARLNEPRSTGPRSHP